jgi:hypothetical protein
MDRYREQARSHRGSVFKQGSVVGFMQETTRKKSTYIQFFPT